MKIRDPRQLRAFIAAVAPLGVLANGCSSPIGEFDAKVCPREAGALVDLAPVAGTDFVALRSGFVFVGQEQPPSTVATWGTACKTASDTTACQMALGAQPFTDPVLGREGFDAVTSYDVVFTSGDDTGRVVDKPGLLELLGAIDGTSEALLVALSAGHRVSCQENNVRREGSGFVLLGTQGSGCGDDVEEYEVSVDAGGNVAEGEHEVTEEGDDNCAIGRRPDGLCTRTGRGRSLGRFFAHAAHLEAASVHAFAQLAGELAAHGAPQALIRAAWSARRDEVRHARVTAALARRFGAEPVRPVVAAPRVRSLYEVALDNGTEGCVRETFGALVATAQARGARHALVRRALGPIAVDETRHATLSWQLDGWLATRLRPAQRRTLAEARRQAVATLRAETARPWSRAITSAAGMPSPEGGLRMLDAIDTALWRA